MLPHQPDSQLRPRNHCLVDEAWTICIAFAHKDGVLYQIKATFEPSVSSFLPKTSFILQIFPASTMHNQAPGYLLIPFLLCPTPKIQAFAHVSLICAFMRAKGWTASPGFLCSLTSGWGWPRGGDHVWSCYPTILAVTSICAGTVVQHSSAKGTLW